MSELKTTKDYFIEFVNHYKEICKIKENDYGKLLEMKEKLLEFNERVQIFNILFNGFEEGDIKYFRNKNIKNFKKELISVKGHDYSPLK